MIRYTFFVLTVMATAATAIAAVNTGSPEATGPVKTMTVIQKNRPVPVIGPIVVEQCAMEDCSDVKS